MKHKTIILTAIIVGVIWDLVGYMAAKSFSFFAATKTGWDLVSSLTQSFVYVFVFVFLILEAIRSFTKK